MVLSNAVMTLNWLSSTTMLGPRNHDDHESAFNDRHAWSCINYKITTLSYLTKTAMSGRKVAVHYWLKNLTKGVMIHDLQGVHIILGANLSY